MKDIIKYYPKSGIVTIVVFLFILSVVGIGVIFLPDSIKEVFLNFLGHGRIAIGVSKREYNAFTDTLIFEIVYFSIVTYIAYILLKGQKKNKPEIILSQDGIFCLPLNCHPMTIPWTKIQEISMIENRAKSKMLVLTAPEFVPEGYREVKAEIRCNLKRISTDPDKIYQAAKKFHVSYKGTVQ